MADAEPRIDDTRHDTAVVPPDVTSSAERSVAIGGGAVSSIVNTGQLAVQFLVGPGNLDQIDLPRLWLRPTPPRPSRTLTGRQRQLTELRDLVSSASRSQTNVGIYGAPGVGKTLVVEHLATLLIGEFPGGVFFERLGMTFKAESQAVAVLNAWAAHAFGNRPLPRDAQMSPGGVRALLSGHGRMLIVFDDVWDVKAVSTLLDAVPTEASILITTRNLRVARQLCEGRTYELGVLDIPEATDLLASRISGSTPADLDLFRRLAEDLGGLALAIDIAGASLDRLVRTQWPEAAGAIARQVAAGSGFGELSLPGDEVTEGRLEAALYFSYAALPELGQSRFRTLGAFAPDADLQAAVVARVWGCEPSESLGQLTAFYERSLLTRTPTANLPRWYQHSLLRAYALALLCREGEEQIARAAHATVYLDLIRRADQEQRHYELLTDYTQLAHALEWSLNHDPGLAQRLIEATAPLQEQFNLIRDQCAWASRLLQTVKDCGEVPPRARAAVTFARALSRLAALPGEDRQIRLMEARDWY